MKRHKYALGLYEFMVHAIHDHKLRHHGELPKRFEMHPAHFDDLCVDERIRDMAFYWGGSEHEFQFHGVNIVIDQVAIRLKMVTADNKVEYL